MGNLQDAAEVRCTVQQSDGAASPPTATLRCSLAASPTPQALSAGTTASGARPSPPPSSDVIACLWADGTLQAVIHREDEMTKQSGIDSWPRNHELSDWVVRMMDRLRASPMDFRRKAYGKRPDQIWFVLDGLCHRDQNDNVLAVVLGVVRIPLSGRTPNHVWGLVVLTNPDFELDTTTRIVRVLVRRDMSSSDMQPPSKLIQEFVGVACTDAEWLSTIPSQDRAFIGPSAHRYPSYQQTLEHISKWQEKMKTTTQHKHMILHSPRSGLGSSSSPRRR